MSGYVKAAGAAMMVGSSIVALSDDGARDINLQYPAPGPVEQEIAGMQLEAARNLASKVNDPSVKKAIYEYLPTTKMGKSDMMEFSKEFADIETQMVTSSMELANRAFGDSLDNQVASGRMTSEEANRQRIENEAALRATSKIYAKRLEAQRIAMARNKWLRDSGMDMQTANVMADMNAASKRTLTGLLSNSLFSLQRERGGVSNYNAQIAGANFSNAALIADQKTAFHLNAIEQQGKMFGGGGGGGGGFASFGGKSAAGGTSASSGGTSASSGGAG